MDRTHTTALALAFLIASPLGCGGNSAKSKAESKQVKTDDSKSKTVAEADSSPQAKPNPATPSAVTLSFAHVGCNRVGWSAETNAEGQEIPLPKSTANEPQLMQTFHDVGRVVKPVPTWLFLAGDIVRNEQPGSATLQEQLDLWQRLWLAGKPEGLNLAAFVGNHEALESVEYSPNEYYEVPNAPAYDTWLSWLTANGHWPTQGNGPPAGGPDLLVGDNSRLTYSFDVPTTAGKHAHFVVINTDSQSSYRPTDAACLQPGVDATMDKDVPGWIALDWITKDLAAAVANEMTDVIFVLGHKPLLASNTDPSAISTGRDTIFNCGGKMLAQGLFTAFQKAQEAGKLGAYLAAHEHLRAHAKLGAPGKTQVWEVIAGNGGSKLEEGHEQDGFGFLHVTVHADGLVRATPWFRAVPDPYYADTQTPTKTGETLVLRDPLQG